MATKKKLLQAAAGTAAAGGAGGLNVEQVFSTYLYDGNGSSQVIENGINLGQSYGSGSVKFDGVDDYMSVPASTDFEFGTGNFTVEAWVNTDYSDYFNIWQNSPVTSGANSTRYFIGVRTDGSAEFSLHAGGGGFTTSAGAVSQGTWAHVAIVRNSGTTYIYVDGVQQASSSLFSGYDFNVSSVHTIGYRVTPNYSSGYMADLRVVKGTAVYTSNFTAPTSPLTAITNTVLLTCQGDGPFVDNSSSSHTVTVDGAKASTFGPFAAAEAGEGGLVWIKNRGSSGIYSGANIVFDTERGVGKRLYTNGTDAEFQQNSTNGQKSFNANGFTLGSDDSSGNYGINWTGYDYASWTFRKAPKFFDVVTYTGTGSAQNISHNLGSVPGMVITKKTSSTSNWAVYHRGVPSGGQTGALLLNSDAAFATAASVWNNTAPTSTHFTVGSADASNISGQTYVAYLFAHNDGDGEFGPDADQDIIKCGSFSAPTQTTFDINLGFEPSFFLVKKTSGTGDWYLIDTMRGFNSDANAGPQNKVLRANTSGAEGNEEYYRPTATGVQGWHLAAADYIYIAIRRGPMAVPTDATDVFAIDPSHATSGSGPAFISNFVTDMVLEKQPTASADWYAITRLMGNKYVRPNSTGVEATGSATTWDYMNGAGEPFSSSPTFQGWMWKRAPSFCDVVAYTGNGTAGRTVSHNLGVAPEMMWIKRRDAAQDWKVYHTGLTSASYYLDLNGSAAESASTVFAGTDPTDVVFSVGSNNSVNASGGTYIAYLFASLDGVSKVGSFSHTYGSDTTVDCGFSSGARFVIIKRSSDSGDWMVFDTERGIVAGNDARLLLNSTAAEATNADNIDPNSGGFVFTGANGGGTYIFYAIA